MRKKDNRRFDIVIGSLILVVVLFVSALQLTGVINLFATDYGTGLNLDTSADFYTHTKQYEPLQGQEWMKSAGAEIMPKDKYIVSWQQGQYSSLVTCRADFQYHARATNEYAWPLTAYIGGVALGRYWITVNYIDVNGASTPIINTKNNWSNPTYVYWQRGADISRYEAGKGHRLPNAQYKDGSELGDEYAGTVWHVPWQEDYGEAQWYTMSTDTIEFKLKGNLVGGLRCVIGIEFMERKNNFLGWEFVYGDALVAIDEAYLASGEGEVIVTSTNAVSSDGTEITPETDIVYTKYVYEEGSQVMMQVDAGYSGASLDPNEVGYNQGWMLEIYDSTGTSRHQEYIPDNVRGYPVAYTVPSGAFIPSDPNDNEWRVVLKNTLFDQSETRLFVVDRFEYMPSQTTITTDKNRYVQFETVSVTLKAYSNEQTGRPIDHFRAWAKYGSVGSTDYAYTVHTLPAQNVGGRLYQASFSFQLTKGDTNVYIRAHAIDDEGRAGTEGERNVFSEQAVGNYQVTVIVTDVNGAPIQDAQASMGSSTATSNANGVASIYVDYGTYALAVSKAGYNTYTQAGIQVQADMSIPVTLQGGVGDFTQLLFILGGIIAIIIVLAAFVYMKRNKLWIFGKKRRK